MFENKFIKASELMSELKMGSEFMADLTMEQLVSFINKYPKRWDFKGMFEQKTAFCNTSQYLAELPCDFYEIIRVRDVETKLNYRASTDVFHYSPDHPKCYKDLTYRENGNYLVLSQPDKPVEIAYLAMKLDDEGIPMVWDNEVYKDALMSYIKEIVFTNLFDEGRIDGNRLAQAKQDYAFNARLLGSMISSISVDEAESMAIYANQMVKLPHHFNGQFNQGDPNDNLNF